MKLLNGEVLCLTRAVGEQHTPLFAILSLVTLTFITDYWH